MKFRRARSNSIRLKNSIDQIRIKLIRMKLYQKYGNCLYYQTMLEYNKLDIKWSIHSIQESTKLITDIFNFMNENNLYHESFSLYKIKLCK